MSERTSKTSSNRVLIWIVVALGIIAAAAAVVIIVLQRAPIRDITNFQECKDAGGVIMESYPEQCRIDGRLFTNDEQVYQIIAEDSDEYIGLTEEEALDKAKQEGVTARVVERDGEALPSTMDFAFGRHNFSVKDGRVYAVHVEGEGVDLPLQE